MPDLQTLLASARAKAGNKPATPEPRKPLSKGNRPDRWISGGGKDTPVQQPTTSTNAPSAQTETAFVPPAASVAPAAKIEAPVAQAVQVPPPPIKKIDEPKDQSPAPVQEVRTKRDDVTTVPVPDVIKDIPTKFEFKGFYKFPLEFFASEEIKKLSGSDFSLLMLLAARAHQFEDVGGRVRLAYSIIQETLGMAATTVSRCQKNLVSLGLLKVYVDRKLGSVYEISPKLRYRPKAKTGSSLEGVKETNQEFFDVYLGQLTPETKARTLAAISDLNAAFVGEENYIIDALRYLVEHGDLNGNTVRFPVGLLMHSYPAIRDHLKQAEHARSEIARRIAAEQQKELEKEAEKAREEQRRREMEMAFNREFPTETAQKVAIDAFLSRNRFASMAPDSARRNMAIADWYESKEVTR